MCIPLGIVLSTLITGFKGGKVSVLTAGFCLLIWEKGSSGSLTVETCGCYKLGIGEQLFCFCFSFCFEGDNPIIVRERIGIKGHMCFILAVEKKSLSKLLQKEY